MVSLLEFLCKLPVGLRHFFVFGGQFGNELVLSVDHVFYLKHGLLEYLRVLLAVASREVLYEKD